MKQKYLIIVDAVNCVRAKMEEQSEVVRSNGYDVRELYHLLSREVNHLWIIERERRENMSGEYER